MDERWLDRDWASAQISGMDFSELKYDPDTGQYCHHGVPYSGTSITRFRNGQLRGIANFLNGYADGISVGWHVDGTPYVYNEMKQDVTHGWHVEWNEDGSIKEKFKCNMGRAIR
jgi:hypothetical protein